MSITITKRYRMATSNELPLPRSVMRDVAPAIFASEPYRDCSDKYRFISTIDALDALYDEGYRVHMVGQSTPRLADKNNFAKHIVRLRHESPNSKGVANEIVLRNSSDTSSSAVMMAGVFRTVCMNGLIAGDISQEVKIRHIGTGVGDYVDGAYTIINQFKEIDKHREAMEGAYIGHLKQAQFAEEAMALRYDETKEHIHSYYLLHQRRQADLASDLFTAFNVVQENLLKGKIQGYTNRGKIKTLRAVTSIDETVRINRELWNLAEKYLEAA